MSLQLSVHSQIISETVLYLYLLYFTNFHSSLVVHNYTSDAYNALVQSLLRRKLRKKRKKVPISTKNQNHILKFVIDLRMINEDNYLVLLRLVTRLLRKLKRKIRYTYSK